MSTEQTNVERSVQFMLGQVGCAPHEAREYCRRLRAELEIVPTVFDSGYVVVKGTVEEFERVRDILKGTVSMRLFGEWVENEIYVGCDYETGEPVYETVWKLKPETHNLERVLQWVEPVFHPYLEHPNQAL